MIVLGRPLRRGRVGRRLFYFTGKQFTTDNRAVFLPEGGGQLLHHCIVCSFSLMVRRIGAAVDQSVDHEHSAHCTAHLTHPSHTAAKGGRKPQSGILVDSIEVGECGKNRLRTIVPLLKQADSLFYTILFHNKDYKSSKIPSNDSFSTGAVEIPHGVR